MPGAPALAGVEQHDEHLIGHADDNISSITDLVDPTRDLAFQYDGVDQLARVDMATGATRREDYVHDLGSNRMRVGRRAAMTDAPPASR